MSKQPNLSAQLRPSTNNFILRTLPADEFERLAPDLEPVELALGQTIYRAETAIDYVYFPNRSMVSVVANTAFGQCAEIGVIGSEGMTGIEVLLGDDTTLNDHIVQYQDGAHRIKTAAIRREFKRGGALHDLLLRFTRLLMVQIGQTALCNRLHSVEERLARWLLLCSDRADSDKLQLTQEFLSMMLGTNRATVTTSAIALQNTGYIKYRRGNITITDREGLEDYSCDCYGIVKRQYDRFEQR